MRWKLWNAALLAALILALGMFAHPRPSRAAANDDVEFVQPPGGDGGDPDSGGPNRYALLRLTSWVSAQTRAVLARTSTTIRGTVGRATTLTRRPSRASR